MRVAGGRVVGEGRVSLVAGEKPIGIVILEGVCRVGKSGVGVVL